MAKKQEQTYFLFGKYSPAALKGISAARTKRASKLIEKAKGKVHSMHALLGEYDLVMVASLPDNEAAAKISVALAKATGIGFTSCPAFSVDRFDKLVAKV